MVIAQIVQYQHVVPPVPGAGEGVRARLGGLEMAEARPHEHLADIPEDSACQNLELALQAGGSQRIQII